MRYMPVEPTIGLRNPHKPTEAFKNRKKSATDESSLRGTDLYL